MTDGKDEHARPSRDAIVERVLRSKCLPSLPTVAAKLLSLTSQPEISVQEICRLVSYDISLSAKVLRVVNSAYYGLPQRVSSVQQAVSILGINAVRNLTLSFSLLTIRGDAKSPFDYERFWQRSLAAAVSARMLLSLVQHHDPEEIFIASLLQNIGEMILAREFPREFEEALRLVSQGHDEIAAELQVLHIDHATIGYMVARKWGFPEALTTPIIYHHAPLDCTTGQGDSVACKIVYLSGLLANVFYSDRPDVYHRRFVTDSKKLFGLDSVQLETITADAHSEVNRVGQYFGLRLNLDRSIAEILQEANDKLAQLNMSYVQMNRELLETKAKLHRLMRELQEKNARLEALVNLDGLTGVYNHRYFQNSIKREIARAVRDGRSLCLIMFDVDHFKRFNDEHGHQMGDLVLREICASASKTLRENDMLARYGGEEFAVLLPNTDLDTALSIAETLRAAIATTPVERGPERYHVTISLGVACLDPTLGEATPEELISQADQALFQAKRQGRNRVLPYSARGRWYQRILA